MKSAMMLASVTLSLFIWPVSLKRIPVMISHFQHVCPSAPPQSDPPAPSDDRLPVERGRAGGAPVRTRGLAPFVAASADLRRLLALGVDVSGWDRRPGIPQLVLRLQWERDMAPRIRFLHDAGVPSDRLAAFITRNPLIFKERLDDLQVRVNYLEAKRFTREQISSVLSRDPFWLMFSTARIDRRLGLYAGLFGLRATELRQLAAKCPDLITSNVQHVKDSLFTIKEEFGFERAELKQILLGKPKVFMLSRWALQDRLQYLHNEMGLTHELIAESPNVLTYRSWRVRQRHLMLNMLRRDQYDRSRPGYVSLDRLVGTTDEEFCRDVAQVPVASYNEFLKTL
ncbi:Transcription termination factor 3, mitochondrial [Amphibalanus amphitrite]|uniref:Transcription termination factor 3, mitochondrial n=1 Tax=Amphibalanus amphitrite TaxID=1232801 RepID=A0A6A4V4C4_AMPAM|nr:Transcription termination factor 3, mitochondrial [Amphibalanus amphitrite]KAF0288593.1 Transcription termination factor 3, mitochondrial [Amphibalanus amphitrite]